MDLVAKDVNDIAILEIQGRLDSTSSKVLEDKVTELLAQNRKKMLMDFNGVDYINSTGLRVLLLTLQQLKKREGRLVLCSIKDYMKEVFDISGYTEIFPIFPSQDEGIQDLS